MNDFCLIPRASTDSEPFIGYYFQQYGITPEDLNKSFDVNATFDKVYVRSDKPKVELNTHRLWVTNRFEPREIFEYLNNRTVYD